MISTTQEEQAMNISLACDHGGLALKQAVIADKFFADFW